ncbi:MAG: AAA family ATPase [Candidatus Dojkabacteria bacterium]|nr:AAA family ATPase [Candidatus Dojkabacteria bacterium]
MPRQDSRKETRMNISEYSKIKNLLSVLTKRPYVDYFERNLKKFFVEKVGAETVDMHIALNSKKVTSESYENVKLKLVDFLVNYFPEKAYLAIDNFYQSSGAFKIQESLKFIKGNTLVSEDYINELRAANKFVKSFVNKEIYRRGGIHVITAPPAGGKTLFILQEAVYQAVIENMKVMLFIVGDMDEYSVASRTKIIYDYYAIMAKKPEQIKNLLVYVYPFGSINIYDIANEIKRSEDEDNSPDFVFIDYDDNLADFSYSENMYKGAAKPYEVMDEYKSSRVIVFASQGKSESWIRDRETSIGFLASSSRKEQIVDAIYAIKNASEPKTNKNNQQKEIQKPNKLKELVVLKDRHNMLNGERVAAYLEINNGIFSVK